MKKVILKSFATVAVLCLLFGMLCFNSFAATSATIAFSSSSVAVGDTVTVTVKFSSDSNNLGAVDGYISYDSSVLEFVYNAAVSVNGSGGKLTISGYTTSGEPVKTFSYAIKFTAKKSGSSVIKVFDTILSDFWDENPIGSPSASATLTVKGSADLSSNANLKSVSVPGTLSPSFSASTTSYKVTVDNNVTDFPISATTADSKASLSVSGSRSLKVGENTRSVIVKAENGTTKTYTFKITRLAGSNPTEPNKETVTSDTSNSDIVVINGKTLYLLALLDNIEIPSNFVITPYLYKGMDIETAHSDIFSMTLICFAEENGVNPTFYIYDETTDSFTPFVELVSSSLTYVILTPDETVNAPSGFTKSEIQIENKDVTAWTSEDEALSSFYLLYAMNSDGEIGFYLYDTVEKTIQRFAYSSFEVQVADSNEVEVTGPLSFIEKVFNKISQNKTLFLAVVTGICALCLIIAIVSFVLAMSYRKKAKKEYDIELK